MIGRARWLLAAVLAAPLAAWAGFANDDRAFGYPNDIDEPFSEQSFTDLSVVGREPTFPLAGVAVAATDPEWQYTLWNSSMPAAVPEPQAALMWLAGLVVFGFIARRRSSD